MLKQTQGLEPTNEDLIIDCKGYHKTEVKCKKFKFKVVEE